MEHIQRIVLCGDSVFLLAIDASLAALPEVETIRINPHLPDITTRIVAQEPKMIVMEKGKNISTITLALLQESIPLILMDSDGQNITIITGTQVQKAESGDLVRIIQRWRGELH